MTSTAIVAVYKLGSVRQGGEEREVVGRKGARVRSGMELDDGRDGIVIGAGVGGKKRLVERNV
jgi:hypothetical protein